MTNNHLQNLTTEFENGLWTDLRELTSSAYIPPLWIARGEYIFIVFFVLILISQNVYSRINLISITRPERYRFIQEKKLMKSIFYKTLNRKEASNLPESHFSPFGLYFENEFSRYMEYFL